MAHVCVNGYVLCISPISHMIKHDSDMHMYVQKTPTKQSGHHGLFNHLNIFPITHILGVINRKDVLDTIIWKIHI